MVVSVPDGIDEAKIRRDVLNRYNLEIGAGLGVFAGKVWRIGLMGLRGASGKCHAMH